MIPLSDELPSVRTPWMTYVILAVMFATWFFIQGAGFDYQAMAASVCNLGMVPGELSRLAPMGTAIPLGHGLACVVDNDPINVLTPFTSMFLHGGWGHLLGNALFFWVFGLRPRTTAGTMKACPARFKYEITSTLKNPLSSSKYLIFTLRRRTIPSSRCTTSFIFSPCWTEVTARVWRCPFCTTTAVA